MTVYSTKIRSKGGKDRILTKRKKNPRDKKKEREKRLSQPAKPIQPKQPVQRAPIDLRDMEVGKVMKPGQKSDYSQGIRKPKSVQQPVEKTGIAKLREEDSVIGHAVRVATDWKTTIALVGTLATMGIGSMLAGAGAKAGAGGLARITHSVTAMGAKKGSALAVEGASIGVKRGLTLTAQRGFIGKPAGNLFSKLATKMPMTRVATNPKNVALTTSLLTKSGMTIGAAATMAGSIFFGQWAQAEASEPISFVMKDLLKQAIKDGDWSAYDEAKEMRDELLNLSAWEKIAMWTPLSPFVGIPNKVRGAIAGSMALDTYQKILREEEGEEREKLSFSEERQISDEEARKRELQYREEDEEYYAKKAKEREKKGHMDEPTWKKVKKEYTDEPWESSDKKVIDDWNAGKSALNFKWLGI